VQVLRISIHTTSAACVLYADGDHIFSSFKIFGEMLYTALALYELVLPPAGRSRRSGRHRRSRPMIIAAALPVGRR